MMPGMVRVLNGIPVYPAGTILTAPGGRPASMFTAPPEPLAAAPLAPPVAVPDDTLAPLATPLEAVPELAPALVPLDVRLPELLGLPLDELPLLCPLPTAPLLEPDTDAVEPEPWPEVPDDVWEAVPPVVPQATAGKRRKRRALSFMALSP
jgi:hypothetical protein